MPSIGGGDSENTNPSLICAPAPSSDNATSGALIPGSSRSDQSLSSTQLTPALLRCAPVSTSKPATVMLSSYAGCAIAAWSSCVNVSQVRCSDDAGGSATMLKT